MMAVLSVLYVGFAPAIVGFFDRDPQVLAIAQSYFAWVAPTYAALGIGIVLGSVMQGAGVPERALLLDGCVLLMVQLPASAFVYSAANHSLFHVWLVAGVSYVALAITLFASYRRGGFLKAALA
jgi:Na+-driven multidrug efflux pump